MSQQQPQFEHQPQSQPPSQPPGWGVPQPEHHRPRHPKGTGRVAVAIYACIVGILIGAVGASGSDPAATASDVPAPESTVTVEVPGPTTTVEVPGPTTTVTAEKTVTAEPAGPSSTIPGEGTFVVGEDIEPGTYRATAEQTQLFVNCYYARLKDLDGGVDSIITNGNSEGQVVVTIKSSDAAFETSGCTEWKRVR